MSRYPHMRAALIWVLKALAAGFAIGLFGQWRYHRGFDAGADSAICAFAVGMEGKGALSTFDACKRISDHSWIVDGFDPQGKHHDQ